MARLIAGISALAIIGAVLSAQAPAFEAASIKVNSSGEVGGGFNVRPDEIAVRNYTLRDIIRNAYGLQRYEIVGGPDWLTRDRFDILARAPAGTSQPQVLQMMQLLLADRFKLRVRRETRTMPRYLLVVARADGRLGPKMRPASFDCAAAQAARARGENPVVPEPTGDMPVCGARGNPGRVLAGGYRVADFARNLGGFAGQPVVDQTGLEGAYDFELIWTPDEPPPPGAPLPAWYDANGPSLVTAVQEQLGLKLTSGTGPLQVLVIDSVERPSAN